MSEELIIELMHTTLGVIALVVGPPVLVILVVGVVSNVLQIVTQVRDQSLAFVPKIVATGILFSIIMPWHMQLLTDFTITLFEMMEDLP